MIIYLLCYFTLRCEGNLQVSVEFQWDDIDRHKISQKLEISKSVQTYISLLTICVLTLKPLLSSILTQIVLSRYPAVYGDDHGHFNLRPTGGNVHKSLEKKANYAKYLRLSAVVALKASRAKTNATSGARSWLVDEKNTFAPMWFSRALRDATRRKPLNK